VGDLLAEAAAGGPVGVGVLRMRVARERGELQNVALGDAPPPGDEAVADYEGTEGASEQVCAGRAARATSAGRPRLNTLRPYMSRFVLSLRRGRHRCLA
jgi:hypothetical protein